ncbi:Crp/Fnr family transcriptional regulator [Mucilaginibacter arboris]|uniref:Cyclic nucleotide-binding domain-containing protein n=1 Tax=Mucilaginibacter arboris TaxID=2682090 RepID=A0A7K1SY12_9SPHI|nr:Crp/Fnr family transcriptional regulator [Mucilaginibacter arboris]MVN22206.1 cyclic nucleotide-binding domain-containing protein [Mucilaginibacter arboris]
MHTDIEIYRQAIMQLNPRVTQEEWDYFQSGFTLQTLKPREYFVEAGKKNHQLGFVTSGLIRSYYINNLGEEITIAFVKEREYATDYTSLIMHKPSRYNFQCLEPTTLITVPYAHIQKGYDKYVGFERNGRLIAEEVLKMQQKRIESFQFDDAEQRYLDFIKQNANLFNRISLTHLSSYLGIERPSLSRIRKKIVGL